MSATGGTSVANLLRWRQGGGRGGGCLHQEFGLVRRKNSEEWRQWILNQKIGPARARARAYNKRVSFCKVPPPLHRWDEFRITKRFSGVEAASTKYPPVPPPCTGHPHEKGR